MRSPKTLARIAGLLYLVVVAGGVVALRYGPGRVIRSGDPTGTAAQLRSSATLFRVAFVGNLVAGTCWLLTAMALYVLLRQVHQLVAAAMVIVVATGTAVSGLGLLHQYTALLLATDPTYAHGLGTAGADALAYLFLTNGAPVDVVFFGLWLLPLGYLVFRSGYLPRFLGVMLVVGGTGYLASAVTSLLAPHAGVLARILFAPGPVAELVLVLWLLVVAVRTPLRFDA